MVHKEDIKIIVDNVVSNLKTKCPTISEMHDMLSSLSYSEQFEQLQSQGLLNPLEEDDIESMLMIIPDFEKSLNSNDEATRKRAEEQLDDINERLFEYGRRLIEGLKYKEIPDIDTSSFVSDDQWGGDRGHNYEWETKQGKLETNQIKAQQEKVKIDNTLEMYTDNYGIEHGRYTDQRLMAMDNYFDGDTKGINYSISHEGYLNKLSNEQRKEVKLIDSLMKDSPGLQQDTILYRGGYFDIHLKPGDNIKFKGYVSTTFQEETSNMYKSDDYGDYDMTYVIHAPKGTKGISGSDDRFTNNNWEHEYVLPRNTSMTILSIDYDTMTCEVVIDG